MNIHIENESKADIFVAIFQHISKFTDHMNLMFENERFYMQSMNSSHVVILEILLPAPWFDMYEVENGGSMTIGVNAALFYKVLKKREKGQKIILSCNSGKDNLHIELSSLQSEKIIFNKEFELPLIDIEMELLSIPDIDHQAEFSLYSDMFSTLVSQLRDFGETLEIDCSEEKIELCSHSSENGTMRTNIPIEDLAEFAIEEGERIHAEFALKYLHEICSYQKLVKKVEIKLSRDFPMMIVFRLNSTSDKTPEDSSIETTTSETENVGILEPKLVFYLAPKMSED